MIVELSKCKVELKEEITYGDIEDIQAVMAGGEENAVKAGNKMLENLVISIEVEEGKKVFYSDEWRRSLPVQDGLNLMTKVSEHFTKQVEVKKN